MEKGDSKFLTSICTCYYSQAQSLCRLSLGSSHAPPPQRGLRRGCVMRESLLRRLCVCRIIIIIILNIRIYKYLRFFPPFTKEHIPVIVTPVHMARFRTSRLRSSLIALKSGDILISDQYKEEK